MNSLARTLTVLSGGIPDRVPVSMLDFMVCARAIGMPLSDFCQNGEAMAEGALASWREYGHDMVLVESGTAALAEACGCTVEYLADSAPVVVGPAIETLDDVDRLRAPDPYSAHPLRENLKATRILSREIGDRVAIMGRADQGPFSLASMLVGMEDFLLLLAQCPIGPSGDFLTAEGREIGARLHRLLAFTLEVCSRFAAAQIEQGAHITSIGESIAGPDVCSPRVYREFEWPYAKTLASRLRQRDDLLAYHICGNATIIVPDMVATGAALLELDYKVDLLRVKEVTLGRTAILGPIDPSGVMALGTPSLVATKCQEAIGILAPGGGFILGPGCALPPTTPPDNIHALVEAAKKYGTYNHAGDLIDTLP